LTQLPLLRSFDYEAIDHVGAHEVRTRHKERAYRVITELLEHGGVRALLLLHPYYTNNHDTDRNDTLHRINPLVGKLRDVAQPVDALSHLRSEKR
jgi:beta-xylosidase